MTRERFLICLLLVVLVAAVPYTFMERALESQRAALDEADQSLLQLSSEVKDLRRMEEASRETEALLVGAKARLLAGDPFESMYRELHYAATASGISLGTISLGYGTPVKDMPDLWRWPATVTVTGTAGQFVAFIHNLENSAYLIEVPPLSVQMEEGGGIEQTLNLGFLSIPPASGGDSSD